MLNSKKMTATTLLLSLALLSAMPALAASAAVNVNTADAETMALLPRVGPVVAQRIIDYREANGRFEQKEELLLIRGIGERTFELIEPYVVLEGESTLTDKVRSSQSTEEKSGR